MHSPATHTAVVGMGNLLMGDEGLGIHALHLLRAEGAGEAAVSLIDAGTDAWAALWQARGCEHLVLIDAVRGGQRPGTLHRLALEELDARADAMSLHDVTLVRLLELENALGRGPARARLVGMEPGRIEPGTELSPTCRRALSELVQAVRREIHHEAAERSRIRGARQCS
jgi:hydrogenase maturation protease